MRETFLSSSGNRYAGGAEGGGVLDLVAVAANQRWKTVDELK